MISPRQAISFAGLLLGFAFLWGTAAPAEAGVILNVDASDPLNVVFQSTGAAADVTRSGVAEGLFLVDFFTAAAQSFATPISGTLKSDQGNLVYNFASGFSGSNPNLRVTGPGNLTQTFVAGSQAFSGSSTSNFNIFNSVLRTQDYIGDIRIRDSFGGDTGVVVGQYRYIAPVPEPSALTMGSTLALIAGGSAQWKRRRRAAGARLPRG